MSRKRSTSDDCRQEIAVLATSSLDSWPPESHASPASWLLSDEPLEFPLLDFDTDTGCADLPGIRLAFPLVREVTLPGVSHLSGRAFMYPGHVRPLLRHFWQAGRAPSHTRRRWAHCEQCFCSCVESGGWSTWLAMVGVVNQTGNSFGASRDVGVCWETKWWASDVLSRSYDSKCALRLFFIYQAWPRIAVPLCAASLGRVIFLIRKRSTFAAG